MVTLANLQRFVKSGHRVTVIGQSEHHYYSGMGPGMLGQTYTPEQIRFHTRQTVENKGGRFVKETATHIDPTSQHVITTSGSQYHYDLLSCNAGSLVPTYMIEGDCQRIFPVKPIEGLIKAQQQLIALSSRPLVKVAVIGGGAAGIEIAGNAWWLLSKYCQGKYEIRIICQGRILHRFPEKVRTAVIKSLEQRDIKFIEHHNVTRISNHHIEFHPGKRHQADLIFMATGVRPSPIFRASGLPTGPEGGLKVNAYLQCTDYPNIFGGGDCVYFKDQPLNKVGVYAVRQNPVLYQNLMASMTGKPLATFSPGGAYLLIFNLGNKSGLFYKKGVMLMGPIAFWIKDYIDRRFMRKFQHHG